MEQYTFMWWRDGFGKGSQQMYFRNACGGLGYDNKTGSISRIGWLPYKSEQDAFLSDNGEIDSLTAVESRFFAGCGSVEQSDSLEQIDFWGAHSRILELGHCSDRMDVMHYRFPSLPSLHGRMELLSIDGRFNIGLSGFSHEAIPGLTLMLKIRLPGYCLVGDADGTLLLQSQTGLAVLGRGADISFKDGELTVSRTIDLPADVFTGFSFTVIPCKTATASEAERVISEASVSIDTSVPVTYDRERGIYTFDTNSLTSPQQGDFNSEENRRRMERLPFTITNPTDIDITVPLCFYKDNNFPISGLTQVLRDLKTGEPLGIQVQLSKNWHRLSSTNTNDEFFYAPLNSPRRYLEGPWLHAYTLITVPAHSAFSAEYNCIYASWGTVWSASHSQLCLAGWGGAYQLWESSAIGTFGESFCYDAETSHGRAFMDDIRPLTVFTRNDASQPRYSWTGCNGGGNFLMYFGTDGEKIPLAGVKVWFRRQGPNLCEVIYRGTTTDGAIECELKANLPRTDDASRCYHTFSYRFLKDAEFSRLAFYQLGADHYNDNDYPFMAIGNDEGACFDLDRHYDGEFPSPLSQTPGYPDGKMQRTEVPGEGLWIASLKARMTDTNSCKFGPVANRMLNLHEFDGVINGIPLKKPAVNLYCTYDFNCPCTAAELTVPEGAGNVIKAGSYVRGVVEYINLPLNRDYYYGTSRIMRSIPADEFNTWKLSHRYSVYGKTSVTASVGTVTQNVPIKVRTDGDTACITVRGGLSYVPLTFTGLSRPDGFSLYLLQNGCWKKIDQSNYGNDFWQCAKGDGWELTFNVEQSGGEYQYKLCRG